MAKRDQQHTQDAVKEDVKPEPAIGDPNDALPANQGSTALATSGYESEGGAGFENMDVTYFKVPFINILQKNSPQVEEENSAYVPGAKAGMLIHSITNELIEAKEQGIVIIPVHVEKKFMEWVPRDQGGGLVGVYEPSDPKVVRLTKGKSEYDEIVTDEGNDLVLTFNIYSLRIKPDDSVEPIVLSCASSNVGPFKTWMTIARGQTFKNGAGDVQPYPLYAHQYRVRTKFMENKKGTWHAFTFGFANGTPPNAEASRMPADSPLSRAAKELRDMVMAGKAQADTSALVAEQPDVADTSAF